jgi:thimet oligopeptidase
MEMLNSCVNLLNQNLLNFTNVSVELLKTIFEYQKSLTIELNDRLANLDKTKLTYSDCFEYNMEEESKYTNIFALIDFEQLHPNKEIREISSELNKNLSIFGIEQSMRQDVYDVISHYYHNQFMEEKQNLTTEQIKYISNTMIGYEMLGLGLDEDKKEKVKEINKKLSTYSSDYNKNLAEVNTEFEFELSQLDGMDSNWLENRLTDTMDLTDTNIKKYKVKLQYPDYIPIMEYCKVRETRKIMLEAMGSKCIETNLPILLDSIQLRKEKAELFGFKSHTDFKLQNLMAKNSETVKNFLSKLVEMIKPLVKSDKFKLMQLAKELDNLDEIMPYDSLYYTRIYTEKESGLNMSYLKNLFSIESVTNGIFSIYQELLRLKFIDITESNKQALYSPDIKLFCVYDFTDNQLTSPLGYFYLDLFPREGKYGHAAMFTFVRKSKYNLPISAIVCNFDPKLNVDFDNVVTYFHEFGHLMHNMVSECEISSLSGTACQRDFVETPSQMFEEWCYCEEPLKRLVLPEYTKIIDFKEITQKINKQNKQMQGMFVARQLSYGLLDQAIHSESIPPNTYEYFNKLTKELFDWEISEKTNILANWSHMFGYDSSYYGYMWSKVYAIDLFSFFESNPLDKELGAKLRKEILSKGGSVDGLDLLKNFMNREPNPNAYIEWLSK